MYVDQVGRSALEPLEVSSYFQGDPARGTRERHVGKLFGTDGVRGQANTQLTPELALALGRAVIGTIGHDGRNGVSERPVIVVGRDPRASGALLEGALVAGIMSAGGDVLLAGVI